MKSFEEVDKIMNAVRHPFRYVFENLRPKPKDLTKEEWEAWVIRHPKIAGSMVDGTAFEDVKISKDHIEIKREPDNE